MQHFFKAIILSSIKGFQSYFANKLSITKGNTWVQKMSSLILIKDLNYNSKHICFNYKRKKDCNVGSKRRISCQLEKERVRVRVRRASMCVIIELDEKVSLKEISKWNWV